MPPLDGRVTPDVYHRNRGINPLLQFSQTPSHENSLVSSIYPSVVILEAKPPFILILFDDPGYGDLSCYQKWYKS